jgi:lipopolysaccharide export system permease protein
MLSIRQLTKAIDSLQNTNDYYIKKYKTDIAPYYTFSRYADSNWSKVNTKNIKILKSFDQALPDSVRATVAERVVSQANAGKSGIDLMADEYSQKQKELRFHSIEWHRKITLSIACIVLFLIGAPLGSIIRKGGLGTPLVFAVIFFVVFHLFNTFGEKFSKEGVTSPLVGMWLSTAVLIPIGVFLIVKAMRDSTLFNQEYYHRTFKKLKIFLATFKQAKVAIE